MTSENEQRDPDQDKGLCKSDAVELDKWVRNEKVRERGRSAPDVDSDL